MKITFLGATEEVTGSRHLVEHQGTKILVDCGMFQGERSLTQRNWDPFPVDPRSIQAIVLTHAHIDHTGYIPVMIKHGFTGKIYCSQATYELCALLLLDSGGLQEEEAKRINKRKQHDAPMAVPLYTEQEAQNSLAYFQPINYDTQQFIGNLRVTLIRSHHILGSAFVVVSDGKQTLTFSGDLGRPQQLIMKSPPAITETDFLVLESTYGDRIHPEVDAIQVLGNIINEAVKRGGIIIIPSFAVERTQTLLYCLYQLKHNKQIPSMPIYLDSPLAEGVSDLFCQFPDDHTLSETVCHDAMSVATYIRTVEDSKKLADLTTTAIIIAGSGMADGGRVQHHLKQFVTDAKNTIIFVGYQARGTLGRRLVNGEKEVKIYGTWCSVKAQIKTITFSAHADCNEIVEWLRHFKSIPKKVFLTHGELESALALQKKLEKELSWSVVVPKYLESFDLD